jgi:hypothetical protein
MLKKVSFDLPPSATNPVNRNPPDGNTHRYTDKFLERKNVLPDPVIFEPVKLKSANYYASMVNNTRRTASSKTVIAREHIPDTTVKKILDEMSNRMTDVLGLIKKAKKEQELDEIIKLLVKNPNDVDLLRRLNSMVN